MDKNPTRRPMESLKDLFPIQLVGRPDLKDLKERKRYLYFLVRQNFKIILGEKYHTDLAQETGIYNEDTLTRGYIDMGTNEVIWGKTANDHKDCTPQIKQAIREKLHEW
ncbi:MAG: hypothetical protein AAB440_02030, partial [Patescibacteria group bacterium]